MSQKKINSTDSAKSIGFSSKGKKPTPKTVESTKEKEKLTKRQIIILVAVTLVAVIISATIIGCVISAKNYDNPDYLKSDLSKYISISEDDYKNYTIDIPLDAATKAGVNRKIWALLAEHKAVDEEYMGSYSDRLPMQVGDVALIYYRGYTVDENGKQIDFEGNSNFSSEDGVWLEVGTSNVIEDGKVSGSFIAGFTDSLIGVIPSDYNKFEKKTTGSVEAGVVMYLSYIVIGEGGNKSATAERIDLSDVEAVNEKYGANFAQFFIGSADKEAVKIGEEIDEEFITRIGDASTDTVYSSMKVEYVTTCENHPFTVNVTFPANYGNAELRGVDAKFDLYITYAQRYLLPEYNEEFITKTLGISEASLASYEGDSIVEKHTSMLGEELEREIEESNHELLSAEMWKRLLARVEVKHLPEVTVQTHYNSYYNEVVGTYQSYTESYSSIDSFAVAYLNNVYSAGLASNGDWQGYITDMAEHDVTQKVIFYYIIREENLMPSDEEFDKIYNQLYDEVLNYYLDLHEEEFSKLEGDEYESELEVLKSEIDGYYGESYFTERAYYYYGTRKMVAMANIKR